jgi:hypothetical protein
MLGFATESRAGVIFNFEDQATFTTQTPFSVTNAGVTATFNAQNPQAGTYAVFPTDPSTQQFHALTGNVLESVIASQIPLPGSAHTAFTPLVVQFSQSLQSISLAYAYLDINHDTVSLQAFAGGKADGSPLTVTGTVPDGFSNPEGSLTLTPTKPFDSIVLSTTSVALAVDNLSATLPNETKPPPVTATAEPTSVLLLGIGALGMMVLGWRQSRAPAEAADW